MELSCDVLVLGAGMAGVSTARRLRERGVEDVMVVEATDRRDIQHSHSSVRGSQHSLMP